MRILVLVAGVLALAACEPTPTVLTIDPALICSGVDSTVRVTGKDFRETPSVRLTSAGGQAYEIKEPDVTYTSEEQLSFVSHPSLGLAAGTYDVTVINPKGHEGTLPMALTVEPPPVLVSIAPASVCDMTPTKLTLTGMLFHDDPMAGPIKVTIGTPTPTVLTEDTGAVVFVNAQTVTVSLPAGLPDGTWSVTIEDADGCSSTLPAALPIVAPPTITTVAPAVAWNGQDTTITITGTGFVATPTLGIALAGGMPVTLTAITLVDAQTVSAVVPMGTPPGDYTLTLTNPSGCATTTTLTVSGMAPIAVTSVIVPFGCNTQPTPVTVDGMYFQSTPQGSLLAAEAAGGDLKLKNVAFVSGTRLTGVVPAGGKIGGPYDLKITNPDGGTATKTGAFTITKLCPPVIDSVTPTSVPHDYNTMAAGSSAITLTGSNFRSDATVVLVDQAGNETQFPSPALTITPTAITLNFNAAATALTDGIYLLRVKEADDATGNGGTGATMWGDYSLFIVTNPSGKFQGAVAAKALPAPRRNHGVVGGENNAAARYLYALAGDGGQNAPTLFADGLMAQLDVFGHIGDLGWQRLRKRAADPSTGDTYNDLPSARTQVAAVQHNRWVYVVGGTTTVGTGPAPQATAPLTDVQRAHILSATDAPSVASSIVAGGTLSAGTYYYKVSVLVAAGTDGYGVAAAETVASDEEVAVVATAGSSVQLDFTSLGTSSVPAAKIAGYRIYRSVAADGVSQSEVWLADVVSNNTNDTYLDTGAVTPAGAHPLPAGMLSAWEPAGTLLIPRAGASVTLATPPTATTPNLYVLGGLSNPTGPVIEKTWEYSTIDATTGVLGSFGPASLTPGGATNCTAENCMTVPRTNLYSSTVTGPPSVTSDVRLVAGVGATSGAVQEEVQVLATGLLGTWASIGITGGGAFTTMPSTYGPIGFYSSGHIAVIGGYQGGNVSNKDEFGNEACSVALVSGACPINTPFVQTAKSASTLGITPSVAFSGNTITSGYLFVVGGSTDGTNAVANVSQGAQ